MDVFKTRLFAKWAKKMRITDKQLIKAIDEIEQGLVEAELGKYLYKKRIALNSGKRDGARTIIAYKEGDRAYFLEAFRKNEKENITEWEEIAFKKLAFYLMNLSTRELDEALINGELIGVKRD